MDQERVTLAPPGGIKRTTRSIEYLGSTKELERFVSKLERYSTKNGTIHYQEEQFKAKLERYNSILLQRGWWEGF